MSGIIIAVVIVAAIGLIAGLGLAIASIVFAVPVDETEVKVRECLPGANCGACGYTGCDGYAQALAKGETLSCNLCIPGGNDTAKAVAEIMGLSVEEMTPMVAAVMCQGNKLNVEEKLEYSGVHSCKIATQLFGGPKNCVHGCIGFGDCVAVCPYEAIFICDGVARINPDKCRACKMCIKTCPRGLIDLFPLNTAKAAVLCKNHDKGAQTRKQCKAGCIGCMKCVKACPAGAVSVENFCAKVDYEKCIGCGECHKVCPIGSIDIYNIKKHQ
ncbi:MAG: RnfABCDGE type electron transport complex subunit B [Oscillospiraceae bacterium]|nr:RnfABCDGE type electron transport complex subunit B [Oscillospiraceae bacterium]